MQWTDTTVGAANIATYSAPTATTAQNRNSGASLPGFRVSEYDGLTRIQQSIIIRNLIYIQIHTPPSEPADVTFNPFKTSLFLFGALLPLPVFLSLSSGGLALADGYGTPGLAVVPISAFTLPFLLPYLAKHVIKHFSLFARHWHSGAILVPVIVIIGTVIPASLILGAPASLFTLQAATPLTIVALGYLLVTGLHHYFTTFLAGYFWGVILSTVFIAAAISAASATILTQGMMPRFDPPLPGMYQLGNYTPSGMIFSGLLGIALSQLYPTPRKRILIACCAFLILSGGMLFGSREAALLLLLTAAIAFIYNMTSFTAWAATLGAAGSALAFIHHLTDQPLQLARGFTRLLQTGTPADSSGESRLAYLEARGLLQFEQSPFFGTLLSFQHSTNEAISRSSSHNTYLDILVDYGLIGGLPFYIIFLCLSIVAFYYFSILLIRKLQGKPGTITFILSTSVLLSLAVSANVRIPFHQWYTALILCTIFGLFLGFVTLNKTTKYGRFKIP